MSGDTTGACLRVAPHIIHETIDGEVIVIDLATGSYYSLRGSAADAWQLISRFAGLTPSKLVGSLASHFGKPREDIDPDVSHFLRRMLEESLLTTVDEHDDPRIEPAGLEHDDNPARVYEPPTFEKYTDMQDLVLLDPVHEVDEKGWPHERRDDALPTSSV